LLNQSIKSLEEAKKGEELTITQSPTSSAVSAEDFGDLSKIIQTKNSLGGNDLFNSSAGS
jgi:hypothetical protein